MVNIREITSKVWVGAILLSISNVLMYYLLKKQWIGGFAFLPLLGKTEYTFFLVLNIGLIIGAFIAAKLSDEFMVRKPDSKTIKKALIGGILMGIGFTLAPIADSTVFVTSLPNLSFEAIVEAVGIVVGAMLAFMLLRKGEGR